MRRSALPPQRPLDRRDVEDVDHPVCSAPAEVTRPPTAESVAPSGLLCPRRGHPFSPVFRPRSSGLLCTSENHLGSGAFANAPPCRLHTRRGHPSSSQWRTYMSSPAPLCGGHPTQRAPPYQPGLFASHSQRPLGRRSHAAELVVVRSAPAEVTRGPSRSGLRCSCSLRTCGGAHHAGFRTWLRMLRAAEVTRDRWGEDPESRGQLRVRGGHPSTPYSSISLSASAPHARRPPDVRLFREALHQARSASWSRFSADADS